VDKKNVNVEAVQRTVPSYLAANMACPGDVDVLYSIHSRLSVDVMLTGNVDGMLEPQNRATIRCTTFQQHYLSDDADQKNLTVQVREIGAKSRWQVAGM